MYRLEDLQRVLMHWLESSIESLVEDALFHTLEGERAFAFNRRAFERQMQYLQPISSADDSSVAADPAVTTIAA